MYIVEHRSIDLHVSFSFETYYEWFYFCFGMTCKLLKLEIYLAIALFLVNQLFRGIRFIRHHFVSINDCLYTHKKLVTKG